MSAGSGTGEDRSGVDRTRTPGWLGDAVRDLVLGEHCVFCRRPGRAWCRDCRRRVEALASPRSGPDLPVPVRALLAYPDVAAAVVAHKEHGVLSLAGPLGALLGAAIASVAAETAPPGAALLLVGVPSRPGAVRARGHDPLARLLARSARLLAGRRPVQIARLLAVRPGVRDQGELDAEARAANLAGAFHCPSSALTRAARGSPGARVIVCDDVVTTGSTVVEAHRALRAVGVPVAGVAAIAVTPRRRPPSSSGR